MKKFKLFIRNLFVFSAITLAEFYCILRFLYANTVSMEILWFVLSSATLIAGLILCEEEK